MEGYLIDQLTLRLGRKRTLEALLYWAEDTDRDAVTNVTILTAIVKRPEFWMPAVRAEVRSRMPPGKCHELIHYVNPFFCFPPHLWMIPPWPWYAFLCWLFPFPRYMSSHHAQFKPKANGAVYFDITYENSQVLSFRQAECQGCAFSTNWRLRGQVSDAMFVSKTEIEPHTPTDILPGYSVMINNHFIWADSPESNNGHAHWCGAVKESAKNPEVLIPIKEYGFYRK